MPQEIVLSGELSRQLIFCSVQYLYKWGFLFCQFSHKQNISADNNMVFTYCMDIMYPWYMIERNDILIFSFNDVLMNMIILGVKVLISCPHVFRIYHWVSRLSFIDPRWISITWQVTKLYVTHWRLVMFIYISHHLGHVMTCPILNAIPLSEPMLIWCHMDPH